MTDPADRLSEALSDRYRIERELGEGGMATVFMAEDLKHDRKVAIKVLKPELAAVLGAERFIAEIKTTAGLQHPNILPLFDSGAADGFLYYVMPYVEGESLRDRLNREKQLPVQEAVDLTSEVADALDYAHRHGVVHRDIKPENILLHDGRPMVADFGIALAVSAAAGGRMTETGLSLGTPHYMSPEQATAEKEITGRSDIYSLAATLYEMLTGEPPHLGGSAQQIIMKIVTEEPAPVTKLRKSVPPNVAAAVTKALEKLPADRFGSAKAFADALEDPSFTYSPAGGGRAAGRTPPGTGRRRWTVAAAAAALVLLGAGAGSWIGSHAASGDRRVATLAIDLDPGDSLSPVERHGANADRPWADALALSPDGRTLVFAGWRDGHRSLLRRSIASGETTPITGTEGAEAPFFSPDGRSVGFWANGWIERVPLEGGTPVQIAPVTQLEGASWGDDGRIVYAGYHSGLRRVSSSGGRVDTLASGLDAHLPWVLPGSEAVLYTVSYGSGFRQRRIESLDLRTGARATVLDNAADARYLPDGYLAFARVGQLMVVPFDRSSLRVGGAPAGVLSDVMQAIGGGGPREWTDAAQYAFSRHGDLAWLSGGITPPEESRAVILDRHGAATPVSAPPEPYLTGRFSPNGRRIALSSPRPGSAGIWIIDRDRPGSVRNILTSGQGHDFGQLSAFIAWSPDGRRLASGGGDSIVVVEAAGGSPPRTIPGGAGQTPAQWLPGDTLLTVTWNSSRGGEIGELPIGADKARIVLRETGTLRYPTVSPDGRWLAYTASEGAQWNVVVRRWPSLDGRRQVAAGFQPAWSRGGKELLYQRTDNGDLMAVEVGPDGPVGTPHELLHAWLGAAQPVRSWDVTADGEHILGLSRDTTPAPPAPVIHVILNWFDQLAATGQ